MPENAVKVADEYKAATAEAHAAAYAGRLGDKHRTRLDEARRSVESLKRQIG